MNSIKKNIFRRALIAVFFCVWFVVIPVLSMMIPLPLERLTEAADIVILGEVEAVRSEWSLDKSIILTVTTIKVKEAWKGSLGYPRIFIQTQGGTIGDLTLKVSDVSVFKEGEEVVVFLNKIDDVMFLQNSFSVSVNFLPSFTVFGKAQGKYSIGGDKIARKWGYILLDKEAERDNVLALAELERRVKTYVRKDLEKRRTKHETIRR